MKIKGWGEATALLEKNKLPFSKGLVVKKSEDALKIAKKFGFPVMLKIISKDVVHKSDVGGVVKANDENAILSEFDLMLKNTKKKLPKAKVDGILVQKFEPGNEIIVGLKRDYQFGAVVIFGLGGIFVEVMKDVVFRVCPIDKKEAIEMINEIKGISILKGARGEKEADIEAIAEIISKTSKLAENKNILEIDFNPIIANENGAKIVDVRIMTE